MKKSYQQETVDAIKSIGDELQKLYEHEGTTIRAIATRSGLSVNSVKSILSGKTGNIASYDSVARALNTNLIDLIIDTFTAANSVGQKELEVGKSYIIEDRSHLPS
jgi:transcriptional regulator with XRE-family HTH domain